MEGDGGGAGECRFGGKRWACGGAKGIGIGKTPRKPVRKSDVSRRDGLQRQKVDPVRARPRNNRRFSGKMSEDGQSALLPKHRALNRFENATLESPVESLRRKKQKIQIPQTERACYYCGTSSTAQWRSGPIDFPVLCNACGVRHRKGKLKIRGDIPSQTRDLASNAQHARQMSSKDHVGALKQARSGSNTSSSGRSGEAVIDVCDTCVFSRVQTPQSTHNMGVRNQCFSVPKWGAKRQRSGWE